MLLKIIDRIIFNNIRKFFLRKRGVYCHILSYIDRYSNFEGGNKISNTKILKSSIGYGTYLASGSILNKVKIGNYSSIGPNLNIIIGAHPTKNFVSTHPAFYSTLKQAGFTFVSENKFDEFQYADTENKYYVQIGNDVWIGSGVEILQGVTIGDGAIIAAGSLVTKSIPSYEIWGGVPAKKIRDRFSEENKEFLLKIKWWNKDINWLNNNNDCFDDIKKLKEEILF